MVVHRNTIRKRRRRFTLDDFELTLISLPTALWYLAFCYIPMFGVVIAFKNYKIKPGKGFLYSLFVNSDWVGFRNFKFLFQNQEAFNMFRNTIGYNLAFIVLGLVVPVTLAMMISQLHSKRMQKVTQTSMFLPYFLSWVVVSYFVYAFLSTDKGLVNQVMRAFGAKENFNFYQSPKIWPYMLVFLNLWKSVGYGMVVYLAAISGIDGDLYEAALIDGATKWQQAKYITIPSLRRMMSIMFVLSVGNVFRTDIGLFYQAVRNSGALASVTTTLDVYVFKALIDKPNVNFASATSFLQSVLGMVFILGADIVVKRIDREAGLF